MDNLLGTEEASAAPLVDLPTSVLRKYASEDKRPTGETYAKEIEKFLGWLNGQGLQFETMPAGTIDAYLAQYNNLMTYNKNASALSAMLGQAHALGIRHVPQTITRRQKPKKTMPNLPPPLTVVASPPAAAAVASAPVTEIPPPPPVPSIPPLPTPGSVVSAAVQKSAPSKAQEAFPHLGQRLRISKVAAAGDAVPPGTPIPVGIYQKAAIEADSGLENFLMWRVRPVHGPFPGQPPALYRIEQLDVQSKPLPGQFWDMAIAADINGGPPTSQYQQQPHHQQTPTPTVAPPTGMHGGFHGVPGLPATAAAPGSMGLVEKLMEAQFRAQEAAQRRYDELADNMRRDSGGKMDPVSLMMLERMRPPPLDIEALMSRVRAEVSAASAASAPLALPQMPPMPIGGDSNPVVEALMAQVKALTDRVMDMAARKEPTAPPADPIEAFAKMMALMQSQQKPAEPVMSKLAEITMAQMMSPQKPKSLVESWEEIKTIKMMAEEIGGDGPSEKPSFAETVTQIIEAVSENADKLGDMLAKLKSSGVASAIRGAAAARAAPSQQTVDGTATPQPQPQKRQKPNDNSVRAFLSMVEATKAKQDEAFDENLFNALRVFVEALGQDVAPYPEVASKILPGYLACNNRGDIQRFVLQVFAEIGAVKNFGRPEVVEPLVGMLHRNFEALYPLLSDGKKKALQDAVAAPAVAAPPVVVEPKVTAPPPPVEPGVEEPDEVEEDEEEEEDDDEPKEETGS